MRYLETLREFDGKHVEPLQEIVVSGEADDGALHEMLMLSDHDEPGVATAATWVVKQWADRGRGFTREQVRELQRLLKVDAPWEAQLHLLQILSRKDILLAPTKKLEKTLLGLVDSSNKFVQAWNLSVLAKLAEQTPALREPCVAALAAAESGGTAAVRARVRKVRKSHDWAN